MKIATALFALLSLSTVDVDRIVSPSQVWTDYSVQQEHAWIGVTGYFVAHTENSYVTLEVTDAENATLPIIPWFSCRNPAGGPPTVIEQDPEGDDAQLLTFDFPSPPHATAWYFKLTLWTDGVPVDSEYFFAGF